MIRSNPHVVQWRPLVAPFEKPSVWKGCWQITNSFGSYALTWFLIYHLYAVSWWFTLPLSVLAGALLIRIFIILHDCSHGSFLPSRRANDIIGSIAGVLTFTPYWHWRWAHSVHHATTGDLDRRGTGDVWTMTVREYADAGRWKRLAYRLMRNPAVLFGIAPVALFLLRHRFSSPQAGLRERRSVWWTNVALLVLAVVLTRIYGLAPYVLLQMTVLFVAGAAGVWLFYVQHQFESAYWERTEDWDWTAAALSGSSYYRLPGWLRWFSGNIGFHHIHHLSCRVPNYNLALCHRSDPLFEKVETLTLRSSFGTARLRLWDEQGRRLVTFRQLKEKEEERRSERVVMR